MVLLLRVSVVKGDGWEVEVGVLKGWLVLMRVVRMRVVAGVVAVLVGLGRVEGEVKGVSVVE